MLAKRIIPCLDVNAGRVVKGVKFIGLRDAGDPVEIARLYDREGADELCFLDITASHENREIILDVVGRTAEQVFMPLTVGGGINKPEDIRKLLNAGADKVSINTGAVARPEFVREAAEKFGSQCIVVAIDAKRDDGRWEVYTHGGRQPTGIDACGCPSFPAWFPSTRPSSTSRAKSPRASSTHARSRAGAARNSSTSRTACRACDTSSGANRNLRRWTSGSPPPRNACS